MSDIFLSLQAIKRKLRSLNSNDPFLRRFNEQDLSDKHEMVMKLRNDPSLYLYVYWILLNTTNYEDVAMILYEFGTNQLPTSILKNLLDRVINDNDRWKFFILNRIASLCSTSKSHPHFEEFQQMLKIIAIEAVRHHVSFQLNVAAKKIRKFDIILDLITNHGINIWLFDYQFTEEELLQIRLIAGGNQVESIKEKLARLYYRIEEHDYRTNLVRLRRFRRKDLVHLCKQYGVSGYSGLKHIGIVRLLLKHVLSKPMQNDELELWEKYWIEDYPFLDNLITFRSMQRADLLKLGKKYWIKMAYRYSNADLIKLLLKTAPSADTTHKTERWQNHWMEDNTLEENFLRLSQMTRLELIMIHRKYERKGTSKWRKRQLLLDLLTNIPSNDCLPSSVPFTRVNFWDIYRSYSQNLNLLHGHSIPQLRKFAKEVGVELNTKLSKDELILILLLFIPLALRMGE